MRVPLFLTTLSGLEDILVKEIKEKLKTKASILSKGIVSCRADTKKIFLFNYLLKSCLRVNILLERGEFKTLDDLYSQAKKIPWVFFIAKKQSFAIDCNRSGEQDFISFDVERSVGQAVRDKFSCCKRVLPQVKLKNPDITISLEVKGNKFFIGLDTTGETLNRRAYKEYFHRAGLNPLIAYAMIRLSGWKKGFSLHDPFCGAGTVLVEARRSCLNIPNLERAKNFALWKMKFLPCDVYKKQARELKAKAKKEKLSISGSDISPRHVQGARFNMDNSKTPAHLFLCDATKAEYDYDFIITNPPFGMRLGTKQKVEKTLRNFRKQLFKHKNRFKNAVVLTLTPNIFKGFKFKKRVLYGTTPVYIMRMR